MRYALILAACLSLAAHADMVASNDTGNELRLMPGACTNQQILEQLKPEFRDQFKTAQATISGRVFHACWIDTHEGAYFVHFGDNAMAFPITMFISEPEA